MEGTAGTDTERAFRGHVRGRGTDGLNKTPEQAGP